MHFIIIYQLFPSKSSFRLSTGSAPPLSHIPSGQLTLKNVGRDGPTVVVQCAAAVPDKYGHMVRRRPPSCRRGAELWVRGVCPWAHSVWGLQGARATWNEGVWGFVAGNERGEGRGLVWLSYSLKLHFESPGALLLAGKQGKDSSGPLSISGEDEEAGILGSELKESL